jgi:endoglucanase
MHFRLGKWSASLLLAVSVWAGTPFNKGINLTNWFQGQNAHQIQNNKYNLNDLQNIKSLGTDVIRLPINLHAMTNGAPEYVIDPLLFRFLDQVVDWCETLQVHLILDNHSFDPAVPTDTSIVQILIPVWRQMAAHFKNRSPLIYYEILNEPHGISDADWNGIQQRVVKAIRQIDSTHTIIVGPAGWNSYNHLSAMPQYADTNLIYTFHFYEPFVFTHQGATWTNPSMAALAGVPFPYMASRMPDCPADLQGTWVENALNDYPNTGTVGYVRQQLDVAFQFAAERSVPIFCGEMGVYMVNSPPTDRNIWYRIVRSYLEEHQTPWTMWDYQGGFGLFEKGSNELFDYDLNVPLLEALGFNVPQQREFVLQPDSVGFVLYDDAFGPSIQEASYMSAGRLDYYHENDPHTGNYCLFWGDAAQYNFIGFNFVPNKDLSYLKDQGFVLDFWLKAEGNPASIDVRFIDTKTDDPDDHPWRMKYTLGVNQIRWDGQWHRVQIALKDFVEGGSWDNGWYNPQGKFDWRAVDKFEIVAEHDNLSGTRFWWDNLQIVHPNAVAIPPKRENVRRSLQLARAYPNPFNGAIRIEFFTETPHAVRLEIYDLLGKKIRTLVAGVPASAKQTVLWDGRTGQGQMAASGIYWICLSDHMKRIMKKVVLVR